MSVLVDTSVWIGHFRNRSPDLASLLAAGEVVSHPVIVGELAVGGLRNRSQTLADLRALPFLPECSFDHSLALIELHHLYGIGLSWGDVQLLASALAYAIPLWTLDTTLRVRAQALGAAWTP